MDTSLILVLTLLPTFVIGGAIGATIAYLYSKARLATLEAEHAADLEKVDWIRDSQEALRETFDALASKALHKNSADFSGRIGQQLGSHATQIGTLKSSLEANITKIDQNIRVLEQKREAAYQGLTQNVANLQRAYSELREATAQLLNALKSGPVRGRWGEIQLRKIVELAGMNEHVSFFEQVGGPEGKPDMLVHLPNQGQITVDSKFPLHAFLEAMASIDPAFRQEKLAEHAKTLRQAIKGLAKKGYWEQFQPSPELVIMFVPVESCLMAAYECDPEIIEFALSQKVILASPITLLGFMKAIAYGWQQFVISKNAKVILEQGKELHKRAATWLEHFRKTGDKIGGVIDAYNASVSSLQTRFFPAARRFEELTSLADELAELTTINKGLNLAPKSEDVGDGAKAIETAPLFDVQPTKLLVTWLVTRDGKAREGPYTCEQLAELLDSGTLESTAMVLAEGETKWEPVTVIEARVRANLRLSGPTSG
jgi:DNA recombination protein RmuC